MSGHADTIRTDLQLAAEQIDALLAENQRYESAKANAETALMQQLEANTRTTGELLESVDENQRLREALEFWYREVDKAQRLDNTGGDSAVAVTLNSWDESLHDDRALRSEQ